MSKRLTVLTSFADLALVFPSETLSPAEDDAEAGPFPAETDDFEPAAGVAGLLDAGPGEDERDLADLLADLEVAGALLTAAVRQDGEARTLAFRDLEQYEVLVAQQAKADQSAAAPVQRQQPAAAW